MLQVNSSVCSFFSFVLHVTGELVEGPDGAAAAIVSKARQERAHRTQQVSEPSGSAAQA